MLKKLFFIIIILCLTVQSAGALNSDEVSAECAVVMVAQTGEVVFGKNEYEKHSMASTTKIMTSLLASESGKLGDEIKVSSEMLNVEGTSMGLVDGDSVSLKELVYGMLLPSGNDAANVTALYLGGTVENFAGIMNARAKQIGMKNTHFVTPSGLDNDDHYSTAFDMALLGSEAIKNRFFLSVCSSKKANLTYGNPPYQRTLYNHNRLLSYYSYFLGIKMGYTKKSGRCLVSYAEKDGVGLVAVTLNDPNDWYDHKQMLNFGFDTIKCINVKPTVPATVAVVGGSCAQVGIKFDEFGLNSSQEKSITQKTYIKKFLYAPVKNGDVVGHTDFYLDGKLLGSVSLTADGNVDALTTETPVKKEKKGFFEKLKEKFND